MLVCAHDTKDCGQRQYQLRDASRTRHCGFGGPRSLWVGAPFGQRYDREPSKSRFSVCQHDACYTSPVNKHFKRIAILILAILFLILGVIGLVLPFLQGFLFIAIGLLLLSLYSPALRAWLDKHTVRYPKLHHIVLKAEDWVVSIIGRP